MISFNTRFVDMWRVPQEALAAGADAPILASIASALRNPEAFNASVRHLHEHAEDTGTEELETIDGRTIERNTGALRLPDGRSLGRVWFFRDITERKAAQAQILWTARSDVLTGLANRAVFMEELERAIAETRRGGSTFAVLYLDLDRFKDVNDTMGHPVGDELLKAVARRLRANTRPSDIVARFGGDEFAVLATGTDADAAAEFAERLIKAIGAPFQIMGNDVRSHTSIGISLSGPSQAGAETMLTQRGPGALPCQVRRERWLPFLHRSHGFRGPHACDAGLRTARGHRIQPTLSGLPAAGRGGLGRHRGRRGAGPLAPPERCAPQSGGLHSGCRAERTDRAPGPLGPARSVFAR